MKKTCSRCSHEKEIKDFYPRPESKDGHQYFCKECIKKSASDRRKIVNNKKTARE